MSSKGGGDQTQRTEPWSGLKPYMQDVYAQGQNLYKSGGPQYFPNATYVPFSEQSNLGIDLLTNRALLGSQWDAPAGNLATNMMQGNNAFTQMAGNTMANTASGNFLNANPYLDQMFNHASQQVGQNWQESVMPGINATFASGGRTGGGAHALTLGRSAGELSDSLAGMAANIYGTNYQSERDRQMAAASGLGNLGQIDAQQRLTGAQLGMALGQNEYNDIGKLMSAGQMVEGKAGEILNDNMARYNYYQNLPEQQLSNYVQWLNNMPATGGTTSTNTNGSALGGAVGGGLMGAMVPSALSSMAASGGVGASIASGLSAIPGWGWMLGGALMGSGLLS